MRCGCACPCSCTIVDIAWHCHRAFHHHHHPPKQTRVTTNTTTLCIVQAQSERCGQTYDTINQLSNLCVSKKKGGGGGSAQKGTTYRSDGSHQLWCQPLTRVLSTHGPFCRFCCRLTVKGRKSLLRRRHRCKLALVCLVRTDEPRHVTGRTS
jgi:hypothetical protein